MSERKDGGPAFPIAFQHDHAEAGIKFQEWGGMSLRDYFAIHCPEEYLNIDGWSIADCKEFLGMSPDETYVARIHWRQVCTKLSYEYADAMIAERDK